MVRPENFFVENRARPLDFPPKSKYNTYYELKKERLGALPARSKPSEEAARRGTRDGRDALEGGPWFVGPLPAHAQGRRQDEDDLRPGPCGGGDRGLDGALAGGPRTPEGDERVLPWRLSLGRGEAVRESGPYGQRFFVFRGRKPAKEPDYAEILKALRGFVEPFKAVLNPLLVGLVGERNEEKCSYSSLTLYWTVILGLFQHLRSRNQMDETRNTRTYAQTVFECSEQPYDPDDPELHTACSQTCRNHLAGVESKALEKVLVRLVDYLVRSKWFEAARVRGCLCIAVDGTLCERKRSSELPEKEKRRYALEARIVTPWGWNIPVMSEAVDAYDSAREKQDCERSAFVRLAEKLKDAFPHLTVCVVGDALYACRPVMDICRKNGWQFVLTFKEGVMPKVYAAVQEAKLRVGRSDWVMSGDGEGRTCGVVSWLDGLEIDLEYGEGVDFRVVTYFCWDLREGRYDGAFVTSFEVNDSDAALGIVACGRRRWNIENGFKVEKNDGFGLEHTFCNDETAGRNYHILMQIAYVLWQVFAHGMLRRIGDGCRKMTQSGWARLLASALRFVGLRAFPKEAVGAMRMRRYRPAA